MEVLVRSNFLFNNKGFRDKLLKALQYTSKALVELQTSALAPWPSLFPPLKALSSHISNARRLYRFGQWFKSVEGLLKLLQGDLSKLSPFAFAKQLLTHCCGFWTDLFDALSFVQLLLNRNRDAADYWGGFFYVLQLAVGALDQIELLLQAQRQILAIRKKLREAKKVDPPPPVTNEKRVLPAEAAQDSSSPETLKKQLSDLNLQKNEAILDLSRRAFDAMPPMKNLTNYFADKNLTTSTFGAIGGFIGTYQAVWSTK